MSYYIHQQCLCQQELNVVLEADETEEWDRYIGYGVNGLFWTHRLSSQTWRSWLPFLQLPSMMWTIPESPISFSSTQVSLPLQSHSRSFCDSLHFFPPNVFIMGNNKGNNEVILPSHENCSGLSWILCLACQHRVGGAWRTWRGSWQTIKNNSKIWKNTIWKERITDLEFPIKTKKAWGQ